jgi:N-acyl-L-homoserine lactone synthetase
MPLLSLNWETAHYHGDFWIEHHRLRHRIFVERKRWNVPSYGGLEYDQFDTPAAKYLLWAEDDRRVLGITRLIPTTERYMIRELWPEMMNREPPRSARIWEASRFGCEHAAPAALRRKIVKELICGCQEIGLENGVQGYLCIMPLAILKNVIGKAGCPYHLIGPSRHIDGHLTAIAYIPVSEEILDRIRSNVCGERSVVVSDDGFLDSVLPHADYPVLPVGTGPAPLNLTAPYLEAPRSTA